MWTGPEALHSIDESLQRLRSQLQEVDQQVQAASKHLVQLQQTTAESFRALAKFRMDRLLSDRVAAALDDVDRRVAALLAARDDEMAALEQRVADNQRLQSDLEAQRVAQRERVNEAAQTLDAAQAKTQQRLAEDPGYRERLEKAKQADAVARQAESKTQQAESDRVAKGTPYEDDPLFMYLWRRGYGTSAYRANSLVRFLDGWVARLCRYHEARPNYYMLLEIPTRLHEHARDVRQAAQNLLEPLKKEELAAAEADGIPQLASHLHAAQQTLAALDGKIREAEELYRRLAEQRAAYLAGRDENFRQSLEATALHLEREPLLSLRRHAEATPSPKDDVLVEQLGDFEFRKTQFAKSLDGYQQIHGRHLGRVQELEDVRRRFKAHDYDDYGSAFANEAMIRAMLNEFLRGLASADDLWGVIEGGHRRRTVSDPTFGSGGFPFELPDLGDILTMPRGGMRFPRGRIKLPEGGFEFPSGGGWRIPSPPSGGPWYGPRSGGGGGIGGGGFRTTGGF